MTQIRFEGSASVAMPRTPSQPGSPGLPWEGLD